MGDHYELSHDYGAMKSPQQNFSSQRGSIGRDDADLVRLGKKPVLKVCGGLYPSYRPSD